MGYSVCDTYHRLGPGPLSYRETYESLCVLLEEYRDADVETVAEQVLAMLGLFGDDLMNRLDPPPGLQHWLVSHGLALVEVTEAASPRVAELVRADDDEEEEDNPPEEAGADPLLQVGDYVEYRTQVTGPRGHSTMGSGRIVSVDDEIVVVVTGSSHDEWLNPVTDYIKRVSSADPASPG